MNSTYENFKEKWKFNFLAKRNLIKRITLIIKINKITKYL